jgi:conjugal transfer ATP-binding protein TraC
MLRTLIDDLDGALRATRIGELLRPPSARPQPRNDATSFSHWLPYRAWLEDRQVFVNRDALGF